MRSPWRNCLCTFSTISGAIRFLAPNYSRTRACNKDDGRVIPLQSRVDMRVLATADLHFNHAHSKPLAKHIIDEMNALSADVLPPDVLPPDVLLVVGDTSVADGTGLEECLSLFKFDGPKLFVAGNHELWTQSDDSYRIFKNDLPRRVRALGWQWLQDDPFVRDDLAIVGSVGWYDYSFAVESLQIPLEDYQRGATTRIPARWNDSRFVKLHRSDRTFLDDLIAHLRSQLDALRSAREVFVAVHHVPFREFLPPRRGAQWDFARAYLGSDRIGDLIREFENVHTVLCGHSHFPVEAEIGPIRAINIGSGYRQKLYRVIDVA
jgi:predicted phosphohydrolase